MLDGGRRRERVQGSTRVGTKLSAWRSLKDSVKRQWAVFMERWHRAEPLVGEYVLVAVGSLGSLLFNASKMPYSNSLLNQQCLDIIFLTVSYPHTFVVILRNE